MHYTYEITNIRINKHYIGTRSADTLDIGVEYFSSSKDTAFIEDQHKNPDDYLYVVLKEHQTREEALQHEIYLHKLNDVAKNPKYYNRSRQTSTGFDTTGATPWNKGKVGKPGAWDHINKDPDYVHPKGNLGNHHSTSIKAQVSASVKATKKRIKIERYHDTHNMEDLQEW